MLIINAGSSSIKFSTYTITKQASLSENLHGQIESIGSSPKFTVKGTAGEILVDSTLDGDGLFDHKRCLDIICNWLTDYMGGQNLLKAVGHRIVHGGVKYTEPVFVTESILDDLAALIPLAPLHQPHNLLAIRAFQELMPDLPQIACFDTAFHRSQPEVAQQYALPRQYFDKGIRRYGFHGISYEYVCSILPVLDAKLSNARIIVAHLGNGASLCAIHKGLSVATTMGFSPLDGLVMGTRCGNLDPAVILHLFNQYKMDVKTIEHLLYYESGLLGVSAISSDMRQLTASSEPYAKEAVDLFVYRIVREIGSLTAALGGLDAVIFTGGIGENSAQIRLAVCSQLAWLGLELDTTANLSAAELLSTLESKVSAWVVNTNENLMIAMHCKQLLKL